jgi:hypothetical protein
MTGLLDFLKTPEGQGLLAWVLRRVLVVGVGCLATLGKAG